jgi:integrase/recombinase XerD
MDLQACLSLMEREMKLRNLSRKTIKSYLYHTRRFLDFTQKPPESITDDDVRKYISYSFDLNKANFSTVRQCIGSLKFLFNSVIHKDVFINVPYPKKEHKLPTILTKEEVSRLLCATTNPKHLLLLKLIYSAGLRVSEVVKLKTTDIDLEDRTLHIRYGKGKRDRIIPIPESLCQEIREFLSPESSSSHLFRSRPDRRGHISIKTAQKVLTKASRKACIKKQVHPHTLRHSFATHLLEQGTDIRFIQKLLGHKRITTTEIYTQVSTVSLKGIRNPLDELPKPKEHKPQ